MIINNLKDKYLMYLLYNNKTNRYSGLGDPSAFFNPSGKNSLTTQELFYQRKQYDLAFNDYVSAINSNAETGYDADAESKNNLYKDIVYIHGQYGKINLNGDSIELKNENSLKNLNTKNNVTAINIVSDQFNKMKFDYEKVKRKNNLSDNSLYYNLEPVKSYVSFTDQYDSYMSSYMEVFLRDIFNTKKIDDIKNISDYIKHFLTYFSSLNQFIFLKSNFIKSNLSTNFGSGLFVELVEEKEHDDDFKKFNKYVRDPLFVAFTDYAMNYGFSVDKKYPWKLIFDLNSPVVKEEYEKLNIIDTEDFLKKHYIETYKIELNYIIDLLYFSYIDIFYITKEKKSSTYRTKYVNEQVCVYSEKIELDYLSYEEYKKLISNEYWIKFYLYLKMIQNNVPGDQDTFNRYYNEALSLLKNLNIDSAIEYVHNITKGQFPLIKNRSIRMA